ncbi:MAG: hypothetical protein LBL67_02275, partial [Coriobacteriales bacterium]|nr:hypothetical protein [Coriobacteriales bacterium]
KTTSKSGYGLKKGKHVKRIKISYWRYTNDNGKNTLSSYASPVAKNKKPSSRTYGSIDAWDVVWPWEGKTTVTHFSYSWYYF